jgi:hypothetical protein
MGSTWNKKGAAKPKGDRPVHALIILHHCLTPLLMLIHDACFVSGVRQCGTEGDGCRGSVLVS